MSERDLIDSKTQKTIAQHNWVKGHAYTSEFGTRFEIAGLLGGGFSESYFAAFKFDKDGKVIRNSYGQPKVERLATTPVINQLNARGIYAPWDPRSKMVSVESPVLEPVVVEVDLDEDDVPEAEVEEVMIPEVSKSKEAREQAEARLIASIANLSIKSQPAENELLS